MGTLNIFLKESPNGSKIYERMSKPESLKENRIKFSRVYKKPAHVQHGI